MKYVVSSTLTEATWRNSEIVGPYDPDRIRRLKDEAGDLYVSGSARLVGAMIADGLVDELLLFVFPLTLGSGQRLFPDGVPPSKFSLAATESYPNGVIHLAYRPEA
jgi:dihydrofolate reductase